VQDVPAGAPKLKVYSREDIENNPGIAYSGGRSPRDPDDDEEYEDDDEDDVEMGQVSANDRSFYLLS
jgi:hypothetical protein